MLKRLGGLKIAGLLLIISIAVLEVWLVNRLSLYGEKLAEIKKAQTVLELENQRLANTISKQSSLAEVESNSAKLGFSKVKDVLYLKPASVASVQ